MIDIFKTYRTRDGRPVRIYSTGNGGRRDVHGAVHGPDGWDVAQWNENGRWNHAEIPQNFDLVEARQFIVCAGTPLEGVSFCGPFDTYDEADAWARRHCTVTYWISEIEPPVEPKVRLKWRDVNPGR